MGPADAIGAINFRQPPTLGLYLGRLAKSLGTMLIFALVREKTQLPNACACVSLQKETRQETCEIAVAVNVKFQ